MRARLHPRYTFQTVKKRTAPAFESALAELEQLVVRMERGEMPLEEALATFQRGLALAKDCQVALQQAEQQIRMLSPQANPDEAGDVELEEEQETDLDDEP